MKLTFLFLLLTYVTGLGAVAPKIVGRLTDKESSKPVEFATIELLQLPDSSFVDAVRSTAEGVFTFEKGDTAHQYCLRVKHLSYKTLIVPVVKKPGVPFYNMGVISMSQNVIGMKEVIVSGAKILVTELPEKTVYTVSEGIKKASVDGIDVLRKVPSVQIDYLNEDITVEGKSNIVIEVDGVTRSKAYLKRLNPKQIDKFEINTTPSGKYDPETDAVINIVTNPDMRYGLKGMVNLQGIPGKDTHQGFLNTNLDYGLEKISYYIGGYGVLSRFGFIGDSYRESLSGAGTLTRNSTSISDAGIISLNTGFNYDPDKLNTLSFNLSYNRNNNDGDDNVFNKLSTGETTRLYRTISNSSGNNSGLSSSLFYKHKFDKDGKKNIEFETRYSNSLNSYNKTNFQTIYFAGETEDYRDPWITEENKTNTQSANARVSYTTPFDSVYVFGTGVNANYNIYDLENISSLTSAPNLEYTDFRAAAYIDFSRTMKKGNLKVGSRFETSNVTINSNDKNDYFSVLPYANAMYRFNQKHNIRLGYTRRVIRPSTGELNPFESVVDSLTISKGNIHLEPAYRDNFQFTYSYKYGKGKYSVTLAPQVFYDFKTKLIQRVLVDLGNNHFESVPQNISNGYETGSGISVNLQLSKVMVNTYFRYIYYHINRYEDQIEAVDKTGWNWNVNVMAPIFYKINFMGFLAMNSPSVNGQREYRSAPMYYLGLRRQLLGSASLMVMAINPFGDELNKSTTILSNKDIYQRSEQHMMLKNAFILTLSYNFKSGKEIQTQRHASDQEESKIPLSF